ncbi:probable 2-oxoglutarate-dependent dioxygenase AOP1 [Coffea arabica]|uniref:Probable 2-oxoglutarate-dependent dioxygenase AOP1 n=1 Tax=Coffea arabica TaxID=13443 RepID=A0ABM4U2P9_COFAR
MGSESDAQSKLPIIEFNEENLTPGTTSWLSTSGLVRQALESCGCFLVKYKKLSQELHDKMFELSKQLFQLPTEIKVQNTSNILGFGYGTNFSFMPLVEYFGIENGATLKATEEFTNLMWPAGNSSFCETAFSYSKLLSELDHGVMRMVFGSYGVEKHLDPLIKSSFYLMRFLKYRAPKTDEINIGLHPHVDKGFLAILDTNQVTGLEIQLKHGEWITYEPSTSPSTFLVIAGEPFQAWSNGRVHAPLHKVVIRGTEEKYTIGLFSFMREKVKIPEELIDEKNPLQFKDFNHLDFLEFLRGGKYTMERPIVAFCGV